MIKEIKPLTPGTRFGKLIVVKRCADRVTNSTVRVAYTCVCDCGNETETTANLLRRGETVSCGCVRKGIGDRVRKHGLCGTPTYQAWAHMKSRCNNPNCADYPDYGGRGITIDATWEDFQNFLDDMGICPDGLSLDRVDVNGNYTASNCRWATDSQQIINTRKRSCNTSGRTGVHWHKQSSRWHAELKVGNTVHYGGRHRNFEDAVKAREQLELKHRGFIRSAEYEEDKVKVKET